MITKWKHGRDAGLLPLGGWERIQLKKLCAVARRLDSRLAIPASSSNFSWRRAPDEIFITRSGLHKRLIEPDSFLRVNLKGKTISAASPKPSDETLLHCALYATQHEANVVLHCHAPEMEFLSAPNWTIPGHELLKALGFQDHTTPLRFPVLPNDQNMETLAKRTQELSNEIILSKGFLLQNHGLYCFGKTLEHALCHLEALLHLAKIFPNSVNSPHSLEGKKTK
jgi:methylthioribulose-1-phosphate dehydratase